jgi:hypothetical protein
MEPLIGDWFTEAAGSIGHVKVIRRFEWILDRSAVELNARWELPQGKAYSERAIFFVDHDGTIAFCSFTSDGKHSRGSVADGTDIHAEAISFVAEMPAGLARISYWPSDGQGFRWAVESKTKKGWNRFMEHESLPQ